MKKITLFIISVVFFASCKKYLEEKSDKKLVVPTTLNDFQLLLNPSITSITDYSAPGITDIGCDDYYLAYSTYQSLFSNFLRNAYSWNKEIWEGVSADDWSSPYSNIYLANVVLEGLDNFHGYNTGNQSTWNDIYGQGLFIRAYGHYSLEETFGQPFRPTTAGTDLGVPLKLKSNLEIKATRAAVQTVYNQIVSDLKQAASLLPNSSTARDRPTKSTAYAVLARVFLSMQDYPNAGAYADSSIRVNPTIFDFNDPSINPGGSNPFSNFYKPNDFIEVLYPSTYVNYDVIRQATTIVDSTLYNSYDNNDLRKSIFFRFNAATNTWYFKGYYSGSRFAPFNGPATDEMYLIRAECYARAGNKNAALADLNALISKRWKNTVPYPVITASDAEDALRKILAERRKELLFRGIRWTDLRRLNQDPRFAITLTRKLNNQVYTLPPNDPRYTYPIPESEIRISGIQQNPR